MWGVYLLCTWPCSGVQTPYSNLHLTSKACKDCQKALAEPEKMSKTLFSFFSPQKASKHNAPQVRSPTPVHPDPVEPILMPGLSLLPPQKVQDEHDIVVVRQAGHLWCVSIFIQHNSLTDMDCGYTISSTSSAWFWICTKNWTCPSCKPSSTMVGYKLNTCIMSKTTKIIIISTKNIEKHIFTENILNLDRWGGGAGPGLAWKKKVSVGTFSTFHHSLEKHVKKKKKKSHQSQ